MTAILPRSRSRRMRSPRLVNEVMRTDRVFGNLHHVAAKHSALVADRARHRGHLSPLAGLSAHSAYRESPHPDPLPASGERERTESMTAPAAQVTITSLAGRGDRC